MLNEVQFRRPVGLGDTITVAVRVAEKNIEKHRVTLDCEAKTKKGETVISGTAELLAPTEKISRPLVVLPEVELRERAGCTQWTR